MFLVADRCILRDEGQSGFEPSARPSFIYPLNNKDRKRPTLQMQEMVEAPYNKSDNDRHQTSLSFKIEFVHSRFPQGSVLLSRSSGDFRAGRASSWGGPFFSRGY